MLKKLPLLSITAFCLIALSGLAQAQQKPDSKNIIYQREFYDSFNPVTALDLIENTPGFTLDEGANVRGFGAASGNILINGDNPAAKSLTLTEILGRISAEQVSRIEIIRGAEQGIELSGGSITANIILTEQGADASLPFALTGWREGGGRLSYKAEASLSYTREAVDLFVGFDHADYNRRSAGNEIVENFTGPDETREELQTSEERATTLTASVSYADFLSGELDLSGKGSNENEETSLRFEEGESTPLAVFRQYDASSRSFEIGGEYARSLGAKSKLALIALVNRERNNGSEARRLPSQGTSQRATALNNSGETIVRLEYDYSLNEQHRFHFGAEGGLTFIDNEFSFFEDEGTGEVPIPAPGANTRVQEKRAEVYISHSWNASDLLKLGVRLATEASTITQSGDVENERSFTFLKPRASLTYVASDNQQYRFLIERLIGQLDFSDFVSSNDFDDEEFQFGNPELQPDKTWRFSAEYERRFGQAGVIEVGVRYDQIEDVQDLLPLGGMFETPGNIGDGYVLAGTLQGAIPMDPIGFNGARLEFETRIQRTRVTDPVTGEKRRFSNERNFRYTIEYIHALPQWNINFGATADQRTDEAYFGLDEFETDSGFVEFSAFLEYAFNPRFKLRLDGSNLNNVKRQSQRTVFQITRLEGVPAFLETRTRRTGPRASLKLIGTL